MILLSLGIIIGLLLAVIAMLSVRRFQTPIKRTINQIENKVKEKGEIFIETEEKEEFDNFINNLPKEEI